MICFFDFCVELLVLEEFYVFVMLLLEGDVVGLLVNGFVDLVCFFEYVGVVLE